MNKIEKLQKELEEREKHCPEETCEQGGTWNYTDILKAKLEGVQLGKKEIIEKIEKIIEKFEDNLGWKDSFDEPMMTVRQWVELKQKLSQCSPNTTGDVKK